MRRTPRPALLLAAMGLFAIGACDAARRQDPSAPAAASVDACTRCHGTSGSGNAAPPRSVGGATDTADVAVGAHQAHLKNGPFRAPVACGECHVVPSRVDDPGHMDGAHATVTFGALASSGGQTPSWDAAAATCSGVYCHGTTLPGGSLPNHAPRWTQVDGTQAACGTCHGIPPPASSGHPAVSGGATACAGCHPGTVKPDGSIDLAGGKHINGVVDLGGMACTSCHGDASRPNAAIAPAPPQDAHGNTSTASLGVGAHQAHLNAGALRGAIDCAECHVVPSDLGHSAVAGPAPVTFGALASSDGATPTWDRSAATCATYCHGATLPGGSNTAPVWTKVDGTQAACGSCHGIPPPASSGHPAVSGGTTVCAGCHPGTVKSDGTIDVAGGLHINGVVDVSGLSCTACHGDATRSAAIAPAPPRDTKGNTSTTAPGVGAHQAHLVGGSLRAALACSDCHTVPSSTSHSNGTVDIAFSALARTGGVSPSFDAASTSCSSVYCHGATLPGGTNTTPQWTRVDGTQAACGSCHGIPPPASSGHPAVSGGTTACAGCHPGTVKADGTIDVAGGKHINGAVDVTGGSCTACHGDSTRTAAIAPAPPRDTKGNTATTALGVGAHQSHLNAGPLSAAIACAECHVVPGDTTHSTATTPPPVTFGALAKSSGAAPAWNRTTATCASVYCHGGTLSGGSDTTPQWTKVDGTQAACGTCHGLPPSTGRHSDHSGRSCGDCHGGTYTRTAADPSRHVNAKVEVGNQITSWNPSTGQCVGCHGSATWR